MTATIAGATLYKMVDWYAIDWHKVNQNVRRLQARIVKATREVLPRETASIDDRLEGLSRMRGNSHVRFLGEERVATLSPYPTKG